MSNFKRKSSAFIFIIIFAIVFSVFVSAGTDNKAVGDVGTGYINVRSSSVTAWTEAYSSGTLSSDYVAVNFIVFNPSGTCIGGPPQVGGVKNIGANYVEAYTSNTNLPGIIGSADSYHAIKRGAGVYETWIFGIQP